MYICTIFIYYFLFFLFANASINSHTNYVNKLNHIYSCINITIIINNNNRNIYLMHHNNTTYKCHKNTVQVFCNIITLYIMIITSGVF